MGINLISWREALKLERAKYAAQGKTDQVAQVDKELARLDGILSTGPLEPLAERVSTNENEVESKPKRTLKKSKGK
jgi:hypothetical protein